MICKIIAEISSNYSGDFGIAKDMISAAKECGANYVKFQTWDTKKLKPGPWDKDGRRGMYEKSQLNEKRLYELSSFCCDKKITFLTSCFCVEEIDLIKKYSKEIKIPGIELKNKELVNRAINEFSNVFISTCGCEIDVFEKLSEFKNIIVMHGVYSYPCPYDCVNLPKMITVKNIFHKFGYSGHADGIWDAIAAISMGACFVEKHFTIDKKLPFVDNKFSILPNELKQICDYAAIFNEMMIDHGNCIQECEEKIINSYTGRWASNENISSSS